MQKITKIVGLSFEGGTGKIFFSTPVSSQFWSQGAEIFCAFRDLAVPLTFWISRPYP